MLQRKLRICIFLLIFIFSEQSDAHLGISINTGISDMELVAPEIVSSLQYHEIKYVRLFDANHQMLEALTHTGIEVMVSIPNNQLQSVGESQVKAEEWIDRNIKPFVPATKITCIVVGDEVLTTLPHMAHILVPAMHHLYSALSSANLNYKIKISSPQSMEMISQPFPPSTATFNSSWDSVMQPFLQFLKNIGSPFMLNAYPNIYDLFRPVPSSKKMDPNTFLYYSSMFDEILDASYYSMEALNFSEIPVILTESSWEGAPSDNALIHHSYLMWDVISQSGTPSRPDMPISIYINEFFSEELQHGRMMYSLDLQSVSHALNGTPGQAAEFCVANSNADLSTLKAGLDWACGPGGANCGPIQPGQPCYDANNLAAIASYAFNDYYQRTQANGGTCNFTNTASLTPTDPSHGSCIFTGSSGSGTNSSSGGTGTGGGGGTGTGGGGTGAGGGGGTGTGGGGTGTNSSTGGSPVPFPPLGPTTSFDSGVSRMQFLNPSYLVVLVIILCCI